MLFGVAVAEEVQESLQASQEESAVPLHNARRFDFEMWEMSFVAPFVDFGHLDIFNLSRGRYGSHFDPMMVIWLVTVCGLPDAAVTVDNPSISFKVSLYANKIQRGERSKQSDAMTMKLS